jgi:hypothetical protein
MEKAHGGSNAAELQLRNSFQACAIHPRALIVLLGHSQIRERSWHDPPWRRARDARILLEVCDLLMVAQEVFVEEALTGHVLGRRVEDRENGVGEDCWLAEIALVGSVGFCGGGFYGLPKMLVRSWCCSE